MSIHKQFDLYLTKDQKRNPLGRNLQGVASAIGHYRTPASSAVSGDRNSIAFLAQCLSLHPRSHEVFNGVDVNESCTSKICHHCGSYRMSPKFNRSFYPVHKVTYCTGSPRSCEVGGRMIARDEPAAEAIHLCFCAQVLYLMDKQPSRYKELSVAEKNRVYREGREQVLPQYKPGRKLSKHASNLGLRKLGKPK